MHPGTTTCRSTATQSIWPASSRSCSAAPVLMGFASEWTGPGVFRTDDYAGVPILIIRGREGKLRAFLNVCRHRGAKVARGCGKARLSLPLSCLDLRSRRQGNRNSRRALLFGRARRTVFAHRAAAV